MSSIIQPATPAPRAAASREASRSVVRANRALSGVVWLALYPLLVAAPNVLMLVPPVPTGRSFLVELSVALGFVGLTQIGIQFVLIGRFRPLTYPYGLDVVLKYHRQIALAAASIWRVKLGIRYELWRVTHTALGISALVLAQLHVSLAGLYVNTPWKQALWIGSSVALVGLVVHLRLVVPRRQRRRPWRVTGVRDEGGGTVNLDIEADGHEGLAFEPGQFAYLKVGGSPWKVEEHPYSIASSAERTARLSFGIKALGDFSGTVSDVKPGTAVYVDGPHGAFSIDRAQAPGYVFIAGGVGITPMMSFLHTLADRGDPRPILLIYSTNTEEELAYSDEIEALKERLDLETRFVLEEPPHDWRAEEGRITGELLERHLPKERFTRSFFVCGPPAMMAAVEEALLEHDVPPTHVHLEKFALA